MIILDATTKTLEIDLAGSVATTELPFVATYVDANQTTQALTGVTEQDGTTNGTTAVTVVSAPAASTSRKVNYLSIVNVDTADVTLTVQYNNNATLRTIFKVTLTVGDQATYVDVHGWTVIDSSGNVKGSATGPRGAQGSTGFGVPGADGADGIDGFPGPQGNAGATGATGAAGPQGSTGLGAPGFDGDEGDEGIPGPPGPAGTSGTTITSRLIAANGNSTDASAATVSSIAISGLTDLDTLWVVFNLRSVAQTTALPFLQNVTDTVKVSDLADGGVIAGDNAGGTIVIRQDAIGATTVAGMSGGAQRNGTTISNIISTFTTNWTGAWTLGFRHGGVTAGGTFYWSWAVYKVAGQ